MGKLLLGIVFTALSFSLFLTAGCTNKASSPDQAIEQSQTINSIQGKTDYLIKQAQAFYNSKEYQQALQLGQYVLSNVDNNSQQARDLIEKTRAALQAAAQQKAGDVKNKLFGK